MLNFKKLSSVYSYLQDRNITKIMRSLPDNIPWMYGTYTQEAQMLIELVVASMYNIKIEFYQKEIYFIRYYMKIMVDSYYSNPKRSIHDIVVRDLIPNKLFGDKK